MELLANAGCIMSQYPMGARLLFWAHSKTGVGVQELYTLSVFRWLITALDSLSGKPPTWPR